MNIAICSSDASVRKTVKAYLEEYNFNNSLSSISISEFISGEDIAQCLPKLRRKLLDIVIIDYELCESNGQDFISLLQKMYKNLIVFIIASNTKNVSQIFRIGAFQLITKPIDKQEFMNDYERALNAVCGLHEELVVNWQSTITVLKYKEIYYIETLNRHLLIHTANQSYECNGIISSFDNELYLKDFIRIHRSFVVNLRYIKQILTDHVVMINGAKVYLSRYRRKALLSAFELYNQYSSRDVLYINHIINSTYY